ncbi:MAG: CHASE domain-containing protein, partial [Pseudomonadota bacterium]
MLGAAGLTLAISSGYASPVFPAAGLALACVLWFDRRVLFGIWLGSALLNLSYAWLGGTLNPATAAVAAAIATGATVQAWAGGWLVNRWLGPAWRDLERGKDVFSFLLFGGVLACVLSASIGVTGLFAAGVIGRAELLFTWWNWYVGDVLGVLVFAPLTLCLLNGPGGMWGERRKRIVAPMLLTLGLVCLSFYGAAHWERQTLDNHIQAEGETVARRIADRLVAHRELLSSLRNFIEVTPDFSFSQFEQFTGITLQDNPDIFAMSFNDLITDDQRLAFERAMSGLSPLGPFQITERDSQQRLVRAATRPEYVVVRYIVPLAKNQQAVGYDIHSEPIRRDAIQRAIAAKSMAVTMPIQLVQEQKKRVGVLELLPVKSTPRAGAKDQTARLLGFAVAVVKVDEMIEIASRGHIPAGLVFQLTDPLAPDGQGRLYRSDAQDVGNDPLVRAANWKTALRMGDRDWVLSVYITESYRQQHRPWIAWVVGGAGLMFATLLQILMLGTTGHTAMIMRKNEVIQGMAATLEEKVTERTEQLSEANRQLTAEIIERKNTEEALRESESSLRYAQEIAHLGNWDWDIEKNEAQCSDETYRIFGFSSEELNWSFEVFVNAVHPEDRERVIQAINEALNGGKPFSMDFRIVQPDGSERIVHGDAEVIINANGKPIYMVGTDQDITDRKR